jgi:hypothetical protein
MSYFVVARTYHFRIGLKFVKTHDIMLPKKLDLVEHNMCMNNQVSL